MTTSIDRHAREKASRPAGPETVSTGHRSRLALAIGIFSGATGATGAGLMIVAFVLAEWRTALGGTTLLLLAGMGGTVLCLRAFLATKERHYQRGQLDGWMRGWRGQEPEIEDPLLR